MHPRSRLRPVLRLHLRTDFFDLGLFVQSLGRGNQGLPDFRIFPGDIPPKGHILEHSQGLPTGSVQMILRPNTNADIARPSVETTQRG